MTQRILIAIGSNIEPEQHIPRLLEALLQLSPRLDVSPIVATTPVDVMGGGRFLNLTACLYGRWPLDQLKAQFNALETAFGRDRLAPNSKKSGRTADLDILFPLEGDAVDPACLPDEPYVRPMLLHLLAYLGVRGVPAPQPLDGSPLTFADHTIGLRPLTICLCDNQYLFTEHP